MCGILPKDLRTIKVYSDLFTFYLFLPPLSFFFVGEECRVLGAGVRVGLRQPVLARRRVALTLGE